MVRAAVVQVHKLFDGGTEVVSQILLLADSEVKTVGARANHVNAPDELTKNLVMIGVLVLVGDNEVDQLLPGLELIDLIDGTLGRSIGILGSQVDDAQAGRRETVGVVDQIGGGDQTAIFNVQVGRSGQDGAVGQADGGVLGAGGLHHKNGDMQAKAESTGECQ